MLSLLARGAFDGSVVVIRLSGLWFSVGGHGKSRKKKDFQSLDMQCRVGLGPVGFALCVCECKLLLFLARRYLLSCCVVKPSWVGWMLTFLGTYDACTYVRKCNGDADLIWMERGRGADMG